MCHVNDIVDDPLDRRDSFFVKSLGVEAYPVDVAFAVPTGNASRIFLKPYPESVRKGDSSNLMLQTKLCNSQFIDSLRNIDHLSYVQ